MTPWSATRLETRRGALARSSSAASGFFFWGMIEEPDAHASETSQNPYSSVDHSTISRAQARQVGGAGRGRRQVVEHEVAVGDRVHGVLGHAGEAQRRRHRPAVGVEVDAGQRARAQRQAAGGGDDRLEAAHVAGHHPEVRQQVVAEVDGLGPLHVGVAGHRPVQVALGHAPPACGPGGSAAPAPRGRGRARTWRRRWPPGRCASAPCAGGRRHGPRSR